MDDADKDLRNGHRERLLLKFINGTLADYEQPELLLTLAIPRRDVHNAARRLIEKFGTVHGILTASPEDLMAVPGIGYKTAWRIKYIHSLTLGDFKGMLCEQQVYKQRDVLHNFCRALLKNKTNEESHVLYFDAEWRMIEDELHSVGTNNWVAFYPRKILQRALALNARSIVLIHNHPTSGMSFSSEDIQETQKIYTMLSTVDVDLYDHLVVSGDIIYSIKDLHILK